MPLFNRRRDEGGAGRRGRASPGTATRPPGPGEGDWRAYDDVAGIYARVHAPRTAEVARDLVALAEIQPGAQVLDVGTGTGVAARAAALAAGTNGIAVGIDPSLPMLAVARGQDEGARYAAAEAIDLPFRDSAFDHVTAVFTLSHFTDYQTALFDVLRVLRPGGNLGLAVWGSGDDEFSRAWDQVAEQFAEKAILQDARRRVMPWADRFSDPNRLKDALHEAGVRNMVIDRREYRFQMTAEDYLAGREILTIGRFLREMLGPDLWETFRHRARETFAERFPDRLNDFRDVILAVGTKPS